VAVDPHLPEHLAEGVLRRPVHHHAHRAVAVVLADQGHAAREIGVGQRRQRDQHLPGKGLGGFHAAILACARMAAPPLPEPPCTPSATTAPCCWPPSSPSPWRVASAEPATPDAPAATGTAAAPAAEPAPGSSYGREHAGDYATVALEADLSAFDEDGKRMIALLVQASQVMDDLYWKQSWDGDREVLL